MVNNDDEIKSLYHYTSFDTFIKIWLGKVLKFGDITLMNDICESRKQISTPLVYGYMERFNLTVELIKPFKQISFTKDYNEFTKGSMSPYMWGHYGCKNSGVCIQFNMEKLMRCTRDYMFRESVKYVDILEIPFTIPHTVNGDTEIKEYLVKHREKLFFTKQNDWKAENEFRIISDKDDWLNIEDSIEAVYTTEPKSLETEYLSKLLPDSIPVMIFGFTSYKGLYRPMTYSLEDFHDYEKANNKQLKANEEAKERRKKKK